MNKEDAEKYLRLLGQELQKQSMTGEILVHDDIYVLIDIKIPEMVDADVYLTNKGDALEVIDAYFGGNGVTLCQTIKRLADNRHLSGEWLQSSINIILSEQQNRWIQYPGICIYKPPLDYVFTMKVIVSEDQYEETDIMRLARELNIADAKGALLVIKKYIPSKLVTSKIRTRIKCCLDCSDKKQKAVVHE